MKKYLSAVLSLILLFSTSSLFAASSHYALIIDAGSTGSRLHLFQYDEHSSVPFIRDVFSESTKPGLSSFAATPAAAGMSLKKLLDDALSELQKVQVDPQSVSISVLATAGMRLLPLATQTAIYTNINVYLKLHYPFAIREVKTIPGKMEGLYGWLDINYLLNSFDSKKDITKGSIDMGGASTQIVFSTSDKSRPNDEISLRIGENNYTVFSKSFLGLGSVQALVDLDTSPFASSCYPLNYPLSTTVTGNFHFENCSTLFSDLINKQEVTKQLLPFESADFIAYSGIYYNYTFFGVNDTTDQALVETQIKSVCSNTWEQLSKEHPEMPVNYLSASCATGVYLSTLLYGSYRLEGTRLTVAHEINHQEIDWTLGALLYQLASKNSDVDIANKAKQNAA